MGILISKNGISLKEFVILVKDIKKYDTRDDVETKFKGKKKEEQISRLLR